ncbi:MAG: hypothetical protein JW768_10955 [Chitinispirillaceae bacterium]|nr:hypothetical protein [Chitinispirillaceae bacterium]
MKSQDILGKPTAAYKNAALTIINNLPPNEFCEVAEEVQQLARRKSFEALERMRLAARRGGLRKKDFEIALRSVRASKRQRHDRRS